MQSFFIKIIENKNEIKGTNFLTLTIKTKQVWQYYFVWLMFGSQWFNSQLTLYCNSKLE